MMTPLPNVRQAYTLLVQGVMQLQVISEPSENLSIVVVQKKTTYSKLTKDKYNTRRKRNRNRKRKKKGKVERGANRGPNETPSRVLQKKNSERKG